jgi:Arc/MetJ family transcription regulator
MERQLLLRANIYAEHNAELVEELQRVALRWNGDTELRNATLRNLNAKL